MNKEEFIYYINHPELLNKKSISEMHELLDEFPYFQTAHLLFLKNLHKLENIKFTNQLKISAAHIINREILYHLLKKEELKQPESLKFDEEEPEIKTRIPEPEVEAADISEEPEDSKDIEKLDITVKIDKKEEEIAIDKQTRSKEILADQVLKRIEEIKSKKKTIFSGTEEDEGDIVEKKTKVKKGESIADSILEEVSKVKKAREKKLKGTTEEKESLKDSKTEGIPEDRAGTKEGESDIRSVSIPDNEILKEDRILLNEEEEIISGEIQSKSSGEVKDKVRSADESVLQVESNKKNDLLDIEFKGGKANEENLNSIGFEKSKEEKESLENQGNLSKEELINKFIEKNPKIVPDQEDGTNQEDISEKSVIENDEFITDTLARVYIRQGYYSKAIFAYEKLILKFPEKSSYFTSQIEKIQRLINKKSQ
jgi:hypothetical protein